MEGEASKATHSQDVKKTHRGILLKFSAYLLADTIFLLFYLLLFDFVLI